VRESSDVSQRQALLAAVRLLNAGAAKQKLQLDEAEVTERLPWTKFLPPADRRNFVSEFLDLLEACVDLGEFTALGRLVSEWKATASLHAEGLADPLKKPIRQVGGKVRKP
jgi:hypothetical protein